MARQDKTTKEINKAQDEIDKLSDEGKERVKEQLNSNSGTAK